MTKLKFLMTLHDRLTELPSEDVEERLRFLSEMIEDRMEEGLTEEEAVAAVGDAEEIAAQILADFAPAATETAENPPKPRWKTGEILLLVLGAPLWLPLLIAAFAVILSLYVSLWAILVSLWAVAVSLVICSVGGAAACVGFAAGTSPLTGLAMLGAGLLCGGLAVVLFLVCKGATKGTVHLTGKIARAIGHCFTKKEWMV